MNLSRTVLGIKFPNPPVLASGIWGMTAASWRAAAHAGAGGVTTKSLWPREHQGNHNPVIIATEHWTLNAVGVPDAGPEKTVEEIGDYVQDRPAPLIANIIGLEARDFTDIARAVAPLCPDAFEANLSTPTFLKLRGKLFAEDEGEVADIIRAVKEVIGDIPLFVKMTPNVANIGEIAAAAVRAGADGITAVNTVGPGMAIDVRSRMPILAAHKGGLSGPALKPIAIRCVAEIYEATEGAVPIIGTGGVYTGEDAAEMLLAGASLVGIGTAVGEDAGVFSRVCRELQELCERDGISDVGELVGGMHAELRRRGVAGTSMKHA